MLRLGAEREELRIVDDQIGAPTPASVIAEATASALAQWLSADASDPQKRAGTYHLTASGRASWFEFAGAIFEGAAARGLIANVPRLHPIPTADYPTRARRPAYSVLDSSRFENAFGIQLPDWRAGLESVLDQLAS
jgi:dTDP-4-dehydrorhamnose reductase